LFALGSALGLESARGFAPPAALEVVPGSEKLLLGLGACFVPVRKNPLDGSSQRRNFFGGAHCPKPKGYIQDRQGVTKMIDENLARLRAHRSNIHRYHRLLKTRLTDLEQSYIETRLKEEEAAVHKLSDSTLPFTMPSAPPPVAA
jgi:hypothetical protein